MVRGSERFRTEIIVNVKGWMMDDGRWDSAAFEKGSE